jgi:hypothetical protein
VVERPAQPVQIYTVYMRLLRDVLQQKGNEREEAAEIMDSGAVDFI